MAQSASPAQEERLQPERQLRNQLAAAARSINWSYALFWSISSIQPGVLTWTDGFYNGEVKTRKISNSAELTADQLIMQRSEQLRELYESLLSGEHDRRAARPVASLSPEDLGDTEWYYVVCMTYAFRPGQGLPGRSFTSNEHVWLCNAHLAGSKEFPRALLAKTIVCIPLMGGVLELGTTDTVLEDPDLVRQASAAFRDHNSDPQCATYSQELRSNPSASEAADIVVFEVEDDLDHNDMEAMIAAGAKELEEAERLSNASLAQRSKKMGEFYSLCQELEAQALEDSWVMDDGPLQVPSSPRPAPAATNEIPATASTPVGGRGSRATSFTAWTRSSASASDEVAVEEPQKLLKKVVAGGGAWASRGGGGSAPARTTQGKNHVASERKRREKLNEMFLILKSLVPSIHKVDKASILAETIAYLKELQRRVQELESKSSRNLISGPSSETRPYGSDERVVRKKVCAGIKRKASEFSPKDNGSIRTSSSNVTVTVSDKDVLLEVQCRWEEHLMTRVFDAIKSLHLDFLSVQASAPDGFMGLKIRAQLAGSGAVVP